MCTVVLCHLSVLLPRPIWADSHYSEILSCAPLSCLQHIPALTREETTSSSILFALTVVADQLVRGKEHCPALLTPPCRHWSHSVPPPTASLPSELPYYRSIQEPAAFLIHPLRLCLPLPVNDWGLMRWAQVWFLVIAVPRTQQAEGGGREINIRVQHPDKHSRAHTINTSTPKCKYIRRDSFPGAQSRLRQESSTMRWV